MKKRIVFLLTALFVFAFSSLASANVEMGMTGSVVQSVQYMLIDTGYLSDGADGALYDGKRDWNLLFGQRAAGAEGARRQTLPDDGRIRLPGGQALP